MLDSTNNVGFLINIDLLLGLGLFLVVLVLRSQNSGLSLEDFLHELFRSDLSLSFVDLRFVLGELSLSQVFFKSDSCGLLGFRSFFLGFFSFTGSVFLSVLVATPVTLTSTTFLGTLFTKDKIWRIALYSKAGCPVPLCLSLV